MTTRQIESPDGRELHRTRCAECGYEIAIAAWCHDPSCCHQSPEMFVDGLVSAEAARGIPVFAVRYPNPLPPYSDDLEVRVWRAGEITPAFTGPVADAVRFEMQHDCPAGQ